VLTGQRLTHRDTVYASHTGDGVMNRTPMRMVRTAHYKYILNVADTIYTTHMDRVKGEGYWDSWRDRSFFDPEAAVILWRYHNRPKEELYDLQSDPDETRNLAAEAPYASIMKAMRERLATWRAEQGDAETGPENLHRDPGSKGPPYIF
jgi:uncharacterized sulfatase